jgi:hypothetical protein
LAASRDTPLQRSGTIPRLPQASRVSDPATSTRAGSTVAIAVEERYDGRRLGTHLLPDSSKLKDYARRNPGHLSAGVGT